VIAFRKEAYRELDLMLLVVVVVLVLALQLAVEQLLYWY
jgi:hypothetical protein